MDGYMYPIRSSLFQCSNYTRIWDILTSYYEKENILLLDGDRFAKDPLPVLQKVETFLELPSFYSEEHFTYNGRKGFPCFKLSKETCMGKNKARDHPELSSETLQYLRRILRPSLEEFNLKTGMNITLS